MPRIDLEKLEKIVTDIGEAYKEYKNDPNVKAVEFNWEGELVCSIEDIIEELRKAYAMREAVKGMDTQEQDLEKSLSTENTRGMIAMNATRLVWIGLRDRALALWPEEEPSKKTTQKARTGGVTKVTNPELADLLGSYHLISDGKGGCTCPLHWEMKTVIPENFGGNLMTNENYLSTCCSALIIWWWGRCEDKCHSPEGCESLHTMTGECSLCKNPCNWKESV